MSKEAQDAMEVVVDGEPEAASIAEKLAGYVYRSYFVGRNALHRVERNCKKRGREFGLLRTVEKDSKKVAKNNIPQVYRDFSRAFSIHGNNTREAFHAAQTNEEKLAVFTQYLSENFLDALAREYIQSSSDLVSHLGLSIEEKFPGWLTAHPELLSTFIFKRDEDSLNLATVSFGLVVTYDSLKEGIKHITIPGECFVTAKTCPEGGFEILSVRTSSLLLKAIFEYTPIRSQEDGKEKVIYPPLKVYGIEIVDEDGEYHEENLKAAILKAEEEEQMAALALGSVASKFKVFCATQLDAQKAALESMMELVQKHAKLKNVVYSDRRLVNGKNTVTLDSAMLFSVYSDLPAVLSGKKKIENCSMLLRTIVWCGVPKLTEALTQILQDGLAPEESAKLDWLLPFYSSEGGDVAPALTQQYADALLEPPEMTVLKTKIAELRGEIDEKEAQGIINSDTVAGIKDRINQEIIHDLTDGSITGPYCDWDDLKEQSLDMTSPRKELASRILMGIGIVVGIGFFIGLGIVTGGAAPAVVASVATVVATVAPPALVGWVIGGVAGVAMSMGMTLYSVRKYEMNKNERKIGRFAKQYEMDKKEQNPESIAKRAKSFFFEACKPHFWAEQGERRKFLDEYSKPNSSKLFRRTSV